LASQFQQLGDGDFASSGKRWVHITQ